MIDNFFTLIEEDESVSTKVCMVYKNNCDDGTTLRLKSIYTLVDYNEKKNVIIEVNIGRYAGENDIRWVKKYLGNLEIDDFNGIVLSGKRYETITSHFPPLVLIGDQEEGLYIIYSKITIGELKRTAVDYFQLVSKN